MSEFTIDIETWDGVSTSEEAVDVVADSLEDRGAGDPSVSMNARTGVVAATFQVNADSFEEATKAGITLFTDALEAAGVHPATAGGMVAVNAEVGAITVAPTRERTEEIVPA